MEAKGLVVALPGLRPNGELDALDPLVEEVRHGLAVARDGDALLGRRKGAVEALGNLGAGPTKRYLRSRPAAAGGHTTGHPPGSRWFPRCCRVAVSP